MHTNPIAPRSLGSVQDLVLATPGRLPVEVQIADRQIWRDLTCQNFMELDCEAAAPGPFNFSALLARFSDSLAAEMCVSASRVTRRQVDADRCTQAYFKLVWQFSGQGRIRQGGHDSELRAGNWAIYDTAKEYVFESSDRARFLVLLLPQHESMGWSPAVAALAGRALPGGGVARIVFSGLSAMLRDGTPLDDESQKTLQDSTIALLERALEGHCRDQISEISGGNALRLQRVKAYILDHLSDPSLTPEKVALTFSMSRRSLYNLFLECEETPRAYIQQVRLDRAARLLKNPASFEFPVAHIARSCGFVGQSHFSRAFHARFGVAPSQWRGPHETEA